MDFVLKKRKELKLKVYQLTYELSKNYDFGRYMELMNCRKQLKQLDQQFARTMVNQLFTQEINAEAIDYVFNDCLSSLISQHVLSQFSFSLCRLKEKVLSLYQTWQNAEHYNLSELCLIYLDLAYLSFQLIMPTLLKALLSLHDFETDSIYTALMEYKFLNDQEYQQLHTTLYWLNKLWQEKNLQSLTTNHSQIDFQTIKDLYGLTIQVILTIIRKFHQELSQKRYIN